MTKLLDGRATAAGIHDEVKLAVDAMRVRYEVTPGLAAVLVGDDPASAVYVRNKNIACKNAGIYAETFNLPGCTSQERLQDLIDRLNKDPRFHGILVQLPLPRHLDDGLIIRNVMPQKDVDCMHPMNLGLLSQGNSPFVPATPGGIQQLLLRNGYSPEGKHVVICGRSNIVGKSLGMLLVQKQPGANATVTLCHTATADIGAITRQADILVAAVGQPEFVTPDMVGRGTVVVDVGINRVKDSSRRSGYRLVGDVQYSKLLDRVEAITPVPGGVGPMTIAMLLTNTVRAARLTIRDESIGP